MLPLTTGSVERTGFDAVSLRPARVGVVVRPAGLTFAAFDLLSVICNAFAVSEQDYCSDRAVGDMKRKDLPTLNLYTVACAACADPVSRRSPTILISQETNR
jgi:hypothetical protein